MRYYDKFWDYGLTNKDLLLNCDIEDLNAMFIPAGHQIKIEIMLGKLKAEAGLANNEMCCGTDDMEMELDPKYLNVNAESAVADKPINIFGTAGQKIEVGRETKQPYNPGKHIDDLIAKLQREQDEEKA
jgi:hypothetical protein